MGKAMDGDAEHHAGARMPGSTGAHPTPSALAERIAADPYGRWLGIELLELRPGYCRAGLTLAPA